MRKTLLLLLLVGCGTTDPRLWDTCEGCAADPNALWEVIADGAEIAGDYDVVGPPDPYMCLTIGNLTKCTSAMSDDASPRWNQTLFHSTTTAFLTSGTVPPGAAIWDEDTGGLDTNDAVCGTSLPITGADLEAGGIRFACQSSMAAFRFKAVK